MLKAVNLYSNLILKHEIQHYLEKHIFPHHLFKLFHGSVLNSLLIPWRQVNKQAYAHLKKQT